MQIELSPKSESLAYQFGDRADSKSLSFLQTDYDCIERCFQEGYISDVAYRKALRKLKAKIGKLIK